MCVCVHVLLAISHFPLSLRNHPFSAALFVHSLLLLILSVLSFLCCYVSSHVQCSQSLNATEPDKWIRKIVAYSDCSLKTISTCLRARALMCVYLESHRHSIYCTRGSLSLYRRNIVLLFCWYRSPLLCVLYFFSFFSSCCFPFYHLYIGSFMDTRQPVDKCENRMKITTIFGY